MTFNCLEQISGVSQVQFYLLTETSNWPVVLTDQNSNQVVFTQETNSIDAAVVPDSIIPDVQKKNDANGNSFPISIKLKFLNRSESFEQLLEQYENKPGVVLVKYNNEFRKILGSPDEPLFLIYQVSDGETISSDGFTSAEIKGEIRSRPVYYTTL